MTRQFEKYPITEKQGYWLRQMQLNWESGKINVAEPGHEAEYAALRKEHQRIFDADDGVAASELIGIYFKSGMEGIREHLKSKNLIPQQ